MIYKHEIFFEEKNPNVKLFAKFVFQRFRFLLCFFVSNFKIKGRYLSTRWFVTCYCLKKAPKIRNNPKLIKEQKFLPNGDNFRDILLGSCLTVYQDSSKTVKFVIHCTDYGTKSLFSIVGHYQH